MIRSIATSLLFACVTAVARAQTQPVMGPLPPEEPAIISVAEVKGAVQAQFADNQPWQAVTVGMQVPDGTSFRTGIRSYVKVAIEPDQVVTLDRLGVNKFLKANIENGVMKSDVGVKYGRMKYEIDAAGREHDATVRSATSTLAVRGTVFEIYDQPPFTPQAVSYTGRVFVRDVRKQISIGRRGGGVVRVAGDKNSAAETALATASFDPAFNTARTPAEQRLIEQVISTGGQISFDVPGGIPVVRGGTPLTFNEASTNFPGAGLNFVLNWTGDADLNLTVALPAFGELITPVAGLNRGKTGGISAFDHRGGKNGGFEVVFFPEIYPGSLCTDPIGGVQAFPTGEVINGRPVIIVPPAANGGPQQTGLQTYITSIDFVSGVAADVNLQTFVRDPVTGKKVFVAQFAGTVNQSIADANFAPNIIFSQFNPAPCNPAAAAVAAKFGVSALNPAAGPAMLTADCGCGDTTESAVLSAPVAKSKSAKKKKRS